MIWMVVDTPGVYHPEGLMWYVLNKVIAISPEVKAIARYWSLGKILKTTPQCKQLQAPYVTRGSFLEPANSPTPTVDNYATTGSLTCPRDALTPRCMPLAPGESSRVCSLPNTHSMEQHGSFDSPKHLGITIRWKWNYMMDAWVLQWASRMSCYAKKWRYKDNIGYTITLSEIRTPITTGKL